jgi:hypothetical protein
VLQFYFLSIMANAVAGMVLASDSLVRRMTALVRLAEPFTGRRGKLLAGLASLLVGVGTLFVPAAPPIVVGDLLPSVAGMVMGIALLFEVFKQDSLVPGERPEKSDRSPVGYRTTLGLLGIASAVLHFFLPERPIL